jgi:hypothetical protein
MKTTWLGNEGSLAARLISDEIPGIPLALVGEAI